jgi:hypothetical protein
MGVNERDRAIDYLQTPGMLSIADVDLLHTRATQSVTYSDTYGDVDSAGFKDCVTQQYVLVLSVSVKYVLST